MSDRVEPTEPWVVVHTDGPDTEHEAAAAALVKYPHTAWKVINYLITTGGATDGEGHVQMGMIKDSYAPARNALMRQGFVEDSGVRVKNERGRNCIFWQPTDRGRTWHQQGDPS